MPYEYAIADVFTDRPFGGSQLTVVFDAQGLNTEQMQAVAREFNFAETTFVLPPDEPGATARLRIFTPGTEMPFAGYPTVGSAAVMAALGRAPAVDGSADIVFTEQVGPVEVRVSGVGTDLAAELRLAAQLSLPSPDPERDAAALGLPADAVMEGWYAGVGMPCGFARLAQRDGRPDADVRLTVRQGVHMGRPSQLRAGARTTAGQLEYVTVGGGVALFATGTIASKALA